MNKHILLVMKWLNNKDSVSQEEREKNWAAARDACEAAAAAAVATYEAYAAAYEAAAAAAANWAGDAANWVDEYFEETGENRNDYKKELEK